MVFSENYIGVSRGGTNFPVTGYDFFPMEMSCVEELLKIKLRKFLTDVRYQRVGCTIPEQNFVRRTKCHNSNRD